MVILNEMNFAANRRLKAHLVKTFIKITTLVAKDLRLDKHYIWNC